MMKRIKNPQTHTSPTRQRGNLAGPSLALRAGMTPATRGGVTLTEVLMSILCMGIGVVAVASLFPIALLRSVQATQLTSGTILRFNAETLVDLHDEFPYNPTMTNPQTRNLVFNPNYPDPDFAEHFLGSITGDSNYLIDPLGAMIVRDENGDPLDVDQLAATDPNVDRVGNIRRFDALRIFNPAVNYNEPSDPTDPDDARQTAERIVTLPDSWITLYEDFPESTANDGRSITLAANTKIDYADARNAVLGGDVRVVLFSKDGNLSEVRPITNPDPNNGQVSSTSRPNEIWWTNQLPNNNEYYDPTGMATNPGAVSQVRIELRERRYTWLLTVRNYTTVTDSPSASVDVVVFFRRSLSAEEETPFTLTHVAGRQYQLSGKPKFLKKGGFLLDTNFGKWHRIQAVSDTNPPIITLERNTGASLNGNVGVFMRGVIDVYPLNRKPSR